MAHNLEHLEQKYSEAEDFIFQTIEMADSTQNELDYFSWKVVKRRQKPQRRYTVSHGAPPAPPSTPTSLSTSHLSPTSADLSTSATADSNTKQTDDSDSDRFQLLYTLDYAPKFKKKLKEQERTAAELAELFKVVTITGGPDHHESTTKTSPEHGVSFASRRIRRERTVGSFKVHRNPVEQQTQELYDEDSLSAPEFTRSTECVPRRRRVPWSRRRQMRRKQLVKHFELMEHLDEIADSFNAMGFRPPQ